MISTLFARAAFRATWTKRHDVSQNGCVWEN